MNIEEKIKNINCGSYIFLIKSDHVGKQILKSLASRFKIFRSDIFIIQESGSIKIEKIREIKKKIYLKPKGKYNLIYIFRAHDLTIEASNSLLKILEEPPAYCIIVLVTDNIGKIIPTINSRLRKIFFSEVEKDINKEYINLLKELIDCQYIYQKFKLARTITENKVNVRKMLVDWIKYLKKDYDCNLKEIEIINKYLKKITVSNNKRLLLENIFLEIN